MDKDETIAMLKQVMAEVAFEMYREADLGRTLYAIDPVTRMRNWATRLDRAVTAEILQAQEAHNAPQTE